MSECVIGCEYAGNVSGSDNEGGISYSHYFTFTPALSVDRLAFTNLLNVTRHLHSASSLKLVSQEACKQKRSHWFDNVARSVKDVCNDCM